MKHEACPKEWRNTEVVTGDHEFDESVARCKNPDMMQKIEMYTLKGSGYGTRTGYNGYSGYSGDE